MTTDDAYPIICQVPECPNPTTVVGGSPWCPQHEREMRLFRSAASKAEAADAALRAADERNRPIALRVWCDDVKCRGDGARPVAEVRRSTGGLIWDSTSRLPHAPTGSPDEWHEWRRHTRWQHASARAVGRTVAFLEESDEPLRAACPKGHGEQEFDPKDLKRWISSHKKSGPMKITINVRNGC